MAQKKSTSTAEVDALLDELLVDAYGDDEQLTALEQGICDALESPIEVYVLGELMSLDRVSYEGNPRRGLVAQCRRDGGREHRISLLDAAALQLLPLELYECGTLDPAKVVGIEGGGMTDTRVKANVSERTWTVFEMQQIVPGRDPGDLDDADSDPIIQASEWHEAGEFEEARTLLAGLLEADLRCLDAHAQLGNMCFDWEVERALNHFEAGVRIGELSLDESFNDLLPWFRLGNRPFLRCLNRYGMCLWRCQRWEEAQQAFENLLALDPLDTFEIQASLPMIAAHQQWPDV